MLNKYACSLLPLANINWFVYQGAFYQLCKFMTGEMAAMDGSNQQWEHDIAPTVSTFLSRLCSGILAHCQPFLPPPCQC